MPATRDQIATGITVSFGGDFPFDIIDFTPPAGKREKVKTSYQGTEDAHTYLPAKLADWDDAKLECILNPSQDVSSFFERGLSDKTSLRIRFPGGASWTWDEAFVTGFEPSGTLEELLKVTVTIAVAGAPETGSGEEAGEEEQS